MATTFLKLVLTLLAITVTAQATPVPTPTTPESDIVPRQAAARVLNGDFSKPFRTEEDGLIWTSYGYRRVKVGSNWVVQLDPTSCPPDFLYGALFGIRNIQNIVGGKDYTFSFQYLYTESTSILWDHVSLDPNQGPRFPKFRYVLSERECLSTLLDTLTCVKHSC